MTTVSLVFPHVKYKEAYLDALKEFHAEGEHFMPHHNGPFARDVSALESDFGGFVDMLNRQHSPETVWEKFVPARYYWLVTPEGEVLGEVNMRLELNDMLEKGPGHVGYHLKPSARGKGYGTYCLSLLKPEAKANGLEKLLLACELWNKASESVITNNGGVFWRNADPYHEGGDDLKQFWIHL